MLNCRRGLALARPTADPTANQLRVCLTLHVLWRQAMGRTSGHVMDTAKMLGDEDSAAVMQVVNVLEDLRRIGVDGRVLTLTDGVRSSAPSAPGRCLPSARAVPLRVVLCQFRSLVP